MDGLHSTQQTSCHEQFYNHAIDLLTSRSLGAHWYIFIPENSKLSF